MRQSLMPVIFATALLFKSYVLSGALPVAETEDNSLEQDTLASLLSDKVTETGISDADLGRVEETRGPRVIVVADPSLWWDLRVMHNRDPLHKRRADYNDQIPEQINAGRDQSIPILRRDSMRCMVGRVYRPCWEV
ncbi:pro-melanin-concentrating hormone, like [Echeneis naucrates]|uniref:pro-melanin-concentrating hormone, like n=1 Tax=Echeneis naucrates TaxID=173247 RepID=UPI0011139A59|nr:pro-MCH-like [Echeneis naucrates]